MCFDRRLAGIGKLSVGIFLKLDEKPSRLLEIGTDTDLAGKQA